MTWSIWCKLSMLSSLFKLDTSQCNSSLTRFDWGSVVVVRPFIRMMMSDCFFDTFCLFQPKITSNCLLRAVGETHYCSWSSCFQVFFLIGSHGNPPVVFAHLSRKKWLSTRFLLIYVDLHIETLISLPEPKKQLFVASWHFYPIFVIRIFMVDLCVCLASPR